MNHDLEKTNSPLDKTSATEVVVDTVSVLISDEEMDQVVGGSGSSVIKFRPAKPTQTKTSHL